MAPAGYILEGVAVGAAFVGLMGVLVLVQLVRELDELAGKLQVTQEVVEGTADKVWPEWRLSEVFKRGKSGLR